MEIDLSGIQSSAKRIFPAMSMELIFAELLLERAQKNLVKYQAMNQRFKAKYEQDFQTFRHIIKESHPNYETEQDYFDWEMAVTGIADMSEEIETLKKLAKSP